MTATKQNTLKKRWVIAPLLPNDVKHALRDYPPFLRQLLFNRGITSAEVAQAYRADRPPQAGPS